MFVVNAGTACSNKIKAKNPQCYNLIEIDEGLRIYRVLPTGEPKLIIDSIHEFKNE